MNIELERKKLELDRVSMAKREMEFVILERLADIDRLKAQIEKQDLRVLELKEHIKQIEGK